MQLKQALRLSKYPRLALVGAGGKTTAMFHLARELKPPVIVTATTHLSVEQTQLAGQHFILQKIEDTNQLDESALSGVILLTGPIEGDRTQGLSEEIASWLREFCGYHSLPLLIEADGSRQLPLKAPAAHEPPIPEFVDIVVVVAGLSGLGKPLTSEWVFRHQRFAELSGLMVGKPVMTEALAAVMVHPEGGLKNIPPKARHIALLNQADTPELQALAKDLSKHLLSDFQAVVITSLGSAPSPRSSVPNPQSPIVNPQSPIPNSQTPIQKPQSPNDKRKTTNDKPQTISNHALHEPIAGIILAGGAGVRYGEPKQLLPWKGRPLVWHVARKALSTGLSPVVVVGGAYTPQLIAALVDLRVEVVDNPDWAEGQSTSVKAGLGTVPTQNGAALFLLADQPQVPEMLILALVEAHSQEGAPIVAPLVQGQRANPVLFDRETFPDFHQLTGDVGGRALFSRFPVKWIPWHDDLPILDIDTPEDYHKLLNGLG